MSITSVQADRHGLSLQYERRRGADACVTQHTQSHPLAIGFRLSGKQACGSDQSQVFAGARSGEPGWPAAVAGL